MVKTLGAADILREVLAAKIRAAFIYGSVAKGNDTATSDIDLMVISDVVPYADLFAFASDAEGRRTAPHR